MLDALTILGSIAIGAVIAINLAALAGTAPAAVAVRVTIAGIAGAWVAFAAAVAAAGGMNDLRVLAALFAAPLVATSIAAALSRTVRMALLGLSLPVLVAVNVGRVIGAFFIALAAIGRLSGPFPFFAGWGDIITGLAAIGIAIAAGRGAKNDRMRITAWNAFGALDLVVAVTLGVTSAPGSAVQLIHAGVGSAAIRTLPWSLIPTALVPFYLIVHAIVFAELIAMKRSASLLKDVPLQSSVSAAIGR